MELLKYTQQIQDVYEALNFIYNGEMKENYAEAYNMLKDNPLTDEFIPKDVFKFITDCADIQIKKDNNPTDEDGRLSYRLDYDYNDVSPREIGERPDFTHRYGLTYNEEEVHNNQDAIRWRDVRRMHNESSS